MQNEDEACWREFHQRYFSRLFAFVAVISGGDDDTISECVQLSFLRIVRHIRRFDEETRFWNWLACLTKCATFDYHRGRKRQLLLLEKYAHWKETQRPSESPMGSVSESLENCLAQLSHEDRRLLERKYYDRVTYAELAKDLSITEKAVEHRLARLRKRLKDYLAKENHLRYVV